jgi:hypothetical protein
MVYVYTDTITYRPTVNRFALYEYALVFHDAVTSVGVYDAVSDEARHCYLHQANSAAQQTEQSSVQQQ